MNIKDFLVGALCGAVAFAIVDRLHYEYERRSSAYGPDSGAADGAKETRRTESSPTTTFAPDSERPEVPAAELEEHETFEGEAAEISGRATANGDPTTANGEPESEARDTATTAPAQARPDGADSKREGSSEAGEATASAPQPDDTTWGPYMEQTLRQFLANHRTAPQFDVLSIQCSSGLCEIRAAAFDESGWPVWQQVMHDLSLQPWYEFGVVGSDVGRYPEYGGRLVVRAKLNRLKRE
jgi:hypothetical protein